MTGVPFVYVGTYTHDLVKGTPSKSEGIYVYRMEQSSGELELVSKATDASNPSFLAVDPKHRFLYAVNELSEFEGLSGGAVSSFSIASDTGELTFLNRQPSQGAWPCHLSVDKMGKYVLVANFLGGSVSVFPIQSGGQLGEATDSVQFRDLDPDPQRRKRPHAHAIVLDPANQYAFVPDLGLDRIMIYRFDLNRGKLIPNDVPWIRIKSGAGPRHFTFHPDGKHAYLINQNDSTLTAFAYNETRGTLTKLQTVPTLPEDFTGKNTAADVHIAPSGQFVYGSNRGHNSIVIYKIIEETGKLTYVGHQSTLGKTPRNFALDPSDTFLFVANQETDEIVTFRVNRYTGMLASTGQRVKVPKPACLKIIHASL